MTGYRGRLAEMEGGQPMGVPLKVRVVSFIASYAPCVMEKRDGSVRRNGCCIPSGGGVAACEKFVDGVATRDMVVEEEAGVSVRLFLPKTADRVRAASNSGTPGTTLDHESQVNQVNGPVEATGEVPSCEMPSTGGSMPSEAESCKEVPRGKLPMVVYFHGGAFVFMTKADKIYDDLCRKIAKTSKVLVISVDYRLAPEHKYPAAVDDGFQVLRWLGCEGQSEPWISEHGDVERTFLMGDSAGGNLVHQVACRARDNDVRPVRIMGQVLMCPFFGGTDTLPSEIAYRNGYIANAKGCQWAWGKYLPQGANIDHAAANPLAGGASSLMDLPPSLVFVAGLDLLHDRGVMYAEGLEHAGVQVELRKYDRMVHAFMLLQYEVQRVLEEVGQFIHSKC